MNLGWTKGGKLHYVITHNVFWANQKTESFGYKWQRATFDLTCLPAIVRASDIASSVLSIRLLCEYGRVCL